MYESFFGLRQRPFSAAPLVNRYVSVAGMEHARHTLARCIERAEGPALVIGPAGSGKTLLCYLLANDFQQRFQPVLLSSGNLSSRRDLLQAILFELDLPYRGLEEGELRLALIDHLTRSPQCPNGILLLVDEGHALPLKLLEELRMITNVVRNGQPRVRLVLVGAPALEERLASPKLESFSQRLAARCYLEPLGRAETWEYVRTQIRLAGGDPQLIISQDGLDAVYKASDGIQRLINQICDQALLIAAQASCRQIDAAIIERAWANLQQLPTPWSQTEPADNDATNVRIEFGDLDDDEPTLSFDSFANRMSVEAASPDRLESDWDAEPICAGDSLPVGSALPSEGLETSHDSWEAGGNEVELVFDEPASEPSELFEINLSLTGLSDAPAQPQWHSTEFCETQPLLDSAGDAACDNEGSDVTGDQEFSEEVVVDRYASLDALQRQGNLPRPQLLPQTIRQAAPTLAERPTPITMAAEKSLTLAEALVQHATALEQRCCLESFAPELHGCQVVAGGASDAWSSVDLLSPSSEQTPTPPQHLEGLAIDLPAAQELSLVEVELEIERGAPSVPLAQSPLGSEAEPDLIVIDDDPPGLQVQNLPQATPVKKQEYRQLFARLRRS